MAGIGSATTGLSSTALARMQGMGLDSDVIDIANRAVAGGTPPTAGTGSPIPPGTGAPAAPTAGLAPSPGTSAPGVTPAMNQAANQLDQPHPQFTNLTQAHVAVFQAIGTPTSVIQQLNGENPDPGWLDQYIQGEIMQNPEGWDTYVQNPQGTARQGLMQLLPGVQLPAAGAGNPGYTMDGTPVGTGQLGMGGQLVSNVPGVTTPIVGPGENQAEGMNGIMKAVVWGAAALGAGLLIWKFAKGRGSGGTKDATNGAASAVKAIEQAFGGGAVGAAGAIGAAGGAGGAVGQAEMAKLLLEHAKLGGLNTRQALVLGAGAVGGGAGGLLGGTAGMHPAVTDLVLRGLPVTTPEIAQVLGGAAIGQAPTAQMMKFFLDNKALDVARDVGMATAFGGGGGAVAGAAGTSTMAKAVLEGVLKAL